MTRAFALNDCLACLIVVLTVTLASSQLTQTVNAQNNARPQRLFRQANSNRPPATNSSSPDQPHRQQQQQQQQHQRQSSAIRLNAENSIDELPADFEETPVEQLDLGANATGRAPNPILDIAVLQNGQRIDSAINVNPGTPLEMIIYLDNKSSKVYGLHASSLRVQDNTIMQREQPIITNGCSIETNIFGNFELNDEDKSLRAKFRAFKFPESSFVRFVGTVNVCIKQCEKVNCSGSSAASSSLLSGSSSSSSSSSFVNSSASAKFASASALNKNKNNAQLRNKRAATKQQSKEQLVLTVSTLLRIGDTSMSS